MLARIEYLFFALFVVLVFTADARSQGGVAPDRFGAFTSTPRSQRTKRSHQTRSGRRARRISLFTLSVNDRIAWNTAFPLAGEFASRHWYCGCLST